MNNYKIGGWLDANNILEAGFTTPEDPASGGIWVCDKVRGYCIDETSIETLEIHNVEIQFNNQTGNDLLIAYPNSVDGTVITRNTGDFRIAENGSGVTINTDVFFDSAVNSWYIDFVVPGNIEAEITTQKNVLSITTTYNTDSTTISCRISKTETEKSIIRLTAGS